MKKILNVIRTTDRDLFHCSVRGSDNSKNLFHDFPNIPKGEYFLCDLIGNTVDLCKKTDREYKVPITGRKEACKHITTLISNCTKQLGTPVNGCWRLPESWQKEMTQ